MANEKTVKIKNEKFYKTIRILGNILFIPFIFIILVSSILMYSAKMRNEVPSLFGYSAVKILTGSMEPEFKVDDIVIVKQVNARSLSVGNVIAFYDYMEDGVDEQDLEDNVLKDYVSQNDENKQTSLASFFGAGATNENQKLAAQAYSKVIFHRIVNISTPTNPDDPNYGKLFFQTKGDKNTNADDHWIMEDYVVGVYINNNSFIGVLFNFCISPVGTILLIVVPSVLLLVILTINLIGEYKKYKQEKENLLLETEELQLKEQVAQNQEQSNGEDKNAIKNDNAKTDKDEKLKDKENTKNENKKIADNTLNKTEKNDKKIADVKTDKVENKDKPVETEKVEKKQEDMPKVKDNKKKLPPKISTTVSSKSASANTSSNKTTDKGSASKEESKSTSSVSKKLPPKIATTVSSKSASANTSSNETTDKGSASKEESKSTSSVSKKLPPKIPAKPAKETPKPVASQNADKTVGAGDDIVKKEAENVSSNAKPKMPPKLPPKKPPVKPAK